MTRENTPRAAWPALRTAAVLAALAAVGPAAAAVSAAAAPAAADAPRTAAVRGLAVPGDGCVRVGEDLPLEELGRIAREEGVGEAVRRGCGREAPPPPPPPPASPPPAPAPAPSRTPAPEAPAPSPAPPEPAPPEPAAPEPAAPPASVPVRPTPSPSRTPSPHPSPTPSPSLRPLYHEPPPREADEGTSPVTRMLLFVAPAILAAAALGGSGTAARNNS